MAPICQPEAIMLPITSAIATSPQETRGGRTRATATQISGYKLSQAIMLVHSQDQTKSGRTVAPDAAKSLIDDSALATMISATTVRKTATNPSRIRRSVPFTPRPPPFVPATCAIIPLKPLSGPLRYRALRRTASRPRNPIEEANDGTALWHGLAEDRRLRAAHP